MTPQEGFIENGYAQKLSALRRQIDQADKKLLEALNARAAISMRIGALKREYGEAVHDPERENRLLDKLEQSNPGPLTGTQLRTVYKEILQASKDLQK